jgi:GNAT superfamily N-acetyltransferase
MAPRVVEIREEPFSALSSYAEIPMSYEVDRVFDVELIGHGLGGFTLSERKLDELYVKDYDADEDEGPKAWAERFDLTNWGLLSAWSGDERVGGTAIAFDTPDVWLLGGRRDLAAVWDMRVRPDRRGAGVGSALWRAAEAWAIERGCTQIMVETQNVNVGACRFYVAQGCELGSAHRFAYANHPDEVQLLWYKRLR